MVSKALLDALVVAQTLGRKVPEPTRTYVLMALLGICLVGLLLIAVTMLGASWVRKQGTFRRGPVVPPDTLLHKPNSLKPVSEDGSTSETYTGNDTISNDDTVVS